MGVTAHSLVYGSTVFWGDSWYVSVPGWRSSPSQTVLLVRTWGCLCKKGTHYTSVGAEVAVIAGEIIRKVEKCSRGPSLNFWARLRGGRGCRAGSNRLEDMVQRNRRLGSSEDVRHQDPAKVPRPIVLKLE